MTWVDQMKLDAARLAFPDWEQQEGDKIDVVATYEPNWSNVTPGQGFEITVIIWRNDEKIHYYPYQYEEAAAFFTSLMEAGSKP